MNRHILLAIEDRGLSLALFDRLRQEGHVVLRARDGGEALTLLVAHGFHVVVADELLPVLNGRTLLGAACRIAPDLMLVLLVGPGSVGQWAPSSSREPDLILHKPFDPGALCARLREAPCHAAEPPRLGTPLGNDRDESRRPHG